MGEVSYYFPPRGEALARQAREIGEHTCRSTAIYQLEGEDSPVDTCRHSYNLPYAFVSNPVTGESGSSVPANHRLPRLRIHIKDRAAMCFGTYGNGR